MCSHCILSTFPGPMTRERTEYVYSANTHRCMGKKKKKINILTPRCKFNISCYYYYYWSFISSLFLSGHLITCRYASVVQVGVGQGATLPGPCEHPGEQYETQLSALTTIQTSQTGKWDTRAQFHRAAKHQNLPSVKFFHGKNGIANQISTWLSGISKQQLNTSKKHNATNGS